jgi:hypothetical protein
VVNTTVVRAVVNTTVVRAWAALRVEASRVGGNPEVAVARRNRGAVSRPAVA